MTTYRITPFAHWDSKWAWFAFRSYAWGGETPVFKVAKAAHYNMVSGERLCCWATQADTDTWNDFDNVTIGETDLEFSNDTPFPAGMIYVSALPMYPFSRVQRRVSDWAQHAHVSNPASATGFVISNSTSRLSVDGRTIPALPFYALKITGSRVGNKNKAILSACNHPSETPGPYCLEGAIAYLLSGAANAETLLNYFEFWVYPCLNPQGVWAGYFRRRPQDDDYIIDWRNTGDLEDVDAYKTAMATDTGGTIAVGIDYHSYMAATDIHASVDTGDTGGNYSYFNTEMQALDAGFGLVQESIPAGLPYMWKSVYSAGLALYLEQGGEVARGVADWKTFGANSMKALYEMLIDGRFTYGP